MKKLVNDNTILMVGSAPAYPHGIGDPIAQLAEMDVRQLQKWFDNIEQRLSEKHNIIGKEVLKEIRSRIAFLLDVGLDYITLNRSSRTLSGGEAQRIRLATQIGSQLVGVLYILDEPSIGLHPRDTQRLIRILESLRNMGNTVVTVEHDEDIIRSADEIIDIGPFAGTNGGELIVQGNYDTVLKNRQSLTSQCLSRHLVIQPYPRSVLIYDFFEFFFEDQNGFGETLAY